MDDNGQMAIIPNGFIASGYDNERNINNGLVIYQAKPNEIQWLEENKEQIQESYNQFVWIPVDDITKFHTIEGYYNNVVDSKLEKCSEPFVN